VVLGVDRAVRDPGERISMQVRESDPLAAAVKAARMADGRLRNPAAYTHAIRGTPIV
jgi:hypothetical protein